MGNFLFSLCSKRPTCTIEKLALRSTNVASKGKLVKIGIALSNGNLTDAIHFTEQMLSIEQMLTIVTPKT